MNAKKKQLRQYGVYMGLLLFFIFIVLIFNINVIQVTTVILLMALASFSKIYKRATSISFGFEFVTVTSMLFAYKIGIVFTLVATFIMLIASAFICGKMKFPDIVVQLITYTLVAIIISLFSSVPFLPLAIIMICFRIIIFTILAIVLIGANFVELGIYFVGNTFFNILIFLTLADFFLNLL